MKNKFLDFNKYLTGIRPARQSTNALIAEQKKWRDQYNKDKAPDMVEDANRKIAETEAAERAQNMKYYEDLLAMGKELIVLAAENAKRPLDLSDEKLRGALDYANKGALSYEQASGIASQFVGNQNALRLLKSTFESKGIHSGIDALIYDPDSLGETMRQYAYNVAWENGSPESYARFIAKFAKFEGVDLPDVGDQDVTDAARRGAGLPPE